jgi:drug/metabolite transporter (DMT)-like permease
VVVALLIAGGAVAHAAWNLVAKRASLSGPAFVWLTSIGAAVVTAPLAIVLAVLEPPPIGPFLTAIAVSGIIHTGYFLALQAGYRAGDVGVVYPLARGTGPLLSVIFAMVLFGERPGPLGLAGAGAIILGVVVIGLAGGTRAGAAARAGILWGLLTGVTIAAYTLWDANAVRGWGLGPVLLSGGTMAVEALLLTPVVLRSRTSRADALDVLRRHRWEALAVAVLSPLAYILILQALQLAPVSIVAPGREVSVVLVGLAGWLLFKEPHPVRRLAGAAVVLAGVGLLAASR